jgi:hypothetical protein
MRVNNFTIYNQFISKRMIRRTQINEKEGKYFMLWTIKMMMMTKKKQQQYVKGGSTL